MVSSEPVLIPISSVNTARYTSAGRIRLCPQVIAKGPASRNGGSSEFSKWSPFVHPEGQPYFVLDDESDFIVVTEANIDDIHTEARILACLKAVSKELQRHNIRVPPRCELFLELARDHSSCNYYFVDHVAKGLFWLEDLDTQSLEIPSAMSPSHLEKALEQLYWVHIEFFPMHHESREQDFSQFVVDIYNIISHGQADRLTSRTSTFPYTADVCSQFLKLLSKKRGQRIDGYTLCYAARLAGAIVNQRFLTFYGQQSAQLDRLQEMCPANVMEHKWLLTLANLLMWGIPQYYIGLLEDLYVNEQVYVDQWTHFISLCLADWTNSVSWSLPVLIASILLTNVHGGSISMSMPPILSCAVSIASASCLHLRHLPLAGSTATAGVRYLRSAKSSTVGFLPSSVAFSLPRATYLWGTGFLIAQIVFVLSHSAGKFIALVTATVVVALLACLLCVIHPEDAIVVPLFRYLVSLCSPRMYSLDAHEGEPMV